VTKRFAWILGGERTLTHYHAATVVSDAVVCIDNKFGARASREIKALGLSDIMPLVIPSEGDRRGTLFEIGRVANDGERGERKVACFFDVDC